MPTSRELIKYCIIDKMSLAGLCDKGTVRAVMTNPGEKW